MKFSYGKRFSKKSIVEDQKNDPRILQYLLYNAEKNWAFAMYLKSQAAIESNKKVFLIQFIKEKPKKGQIPPQKEVQEGRVPGQNTPTNMQLAH
jgi:hypothetical protein